MLQNLDAVGVDINPLAYLTDKVKTTRLNPDILKQEIEAISDEIQQKIKALRNEKYYVKAYHFRNISHCFKSNVIDELTIIKDSITKEKYKNLSQYIG